MNRIILVLFLIFLSAPVFCANVFNSRADLSYIVKNLPELKSVNCKFVQEKFIPSSNLTLKSGGDFSFEKNKGITFYTKYPVKSVTSYTQKEYRQINSIINAISNKQYSKIEKEFDFYFLKTGEIWTLGLKPKSSGASANYLNSIEIEGRSDISKIVIVTKDGAKTTIRFAK